MVRLHIIFCLAACCFMHNAVSQKVAWSPPLSDSKLDYIKVLGQNDNGFYVLRSNHPISSDNEYSMHRNARFLVSFYNYDMRLLWEKAPEALKKDVRILAFVPVADKLTEISLEWNKPEGKFKILSRFFNSAGIADTIYNVLTESDFSSVDDDATFRITASKDMNNFLIAYENEYENATQRYTALVCDDGFKVIKKSAIAIPLSKKYFNVSRFLVSNNRDVFLFGIKTAEEKRSRDPDRNFYTLYRDNGTEQWSEYPIRSPEKFLTDAGITVDEMNHKIVIAGFYSDKTSYSVAGAFYYTLNLTTGIVDSMGYSTFTAGFLYKFSAEQKENYNRELVNYSIDRIILRND